MKTKIFLSGLMMLLLLSACKPDELITFDSTDHIVFRYRIVIMGGDPHESRVDSATVNLADFEQTSVRFGIAVQSLGAVSDVDRPISARVIPSLSTVISGDIDFLPSYIRAGRIVDTLWVQLNETESLRAGRQFRAVFELQDNAYFNSNFKFEERRDGERVYEVALFTVNVFSDGSFPNLWRELMIAGGNALHSIITPARARCKVIFELMREASGLSEEAFWEFFTYDPGYFINDSRPQHPSVLYVVDNGLTDVLNIWARMMSRTLREAREAGNPIRDEDGVEIVLGGFYNNL